MTVTKVFRVEILKPTNYTWDEFGSIVSKATYASAQLANEVISKQYLIAKGQIDRSGSSFCSLIESCKGAPINTGVRCPICQLARKKFNSSARSIMRGDVSLPTFRNNSLYLRASRVKLSCNKEGQWLARLSILPRRSDGTPQPEVMLRTENIQSTSLGYYQILERIASGEYKLGNTQIKRDKVRKKLYMLMSYTFEPSKQGALNPERVMGIDLGVATPAYCAFNDSLKRKSFIVEGKKLLKTKRAIGARRRDTLREISQRDKRRGHGRSGKYSPIQQLERKWVNFRRTWNHTLARMTVEYAVSNEAGIIHIEDLSPDGIPRFLGKQWPVYELLELIKQKGQECGIKVERINPYKTSQTCSRCGAVAENFSFKERSKRGFPSFNCDTCGFQDNADYNAAKNIAKSTLKSE